jgi:hypothetical protein
MMLKTLNSSNSVTLSALLVFFFRKKKVKKKKKKKKYKPHAHGHTHRQRRGVGVHGHHGAGEAQQKNLHNKIVWTFSAQWPIINCPLKKKNNKKKILYDDSSPQKNYMEWASHNIVLQIKKFINFLSPNLQAL